MSGHADQQNHVQILFGYHSAPSAWNRENPGGLSIELRTGGTLIYKTFLTNGKVKDRAVFRVSQECVGEIRQIIRENEPILQEMERQINEGGPYEDENYFIFNDRRIVDWNDIRYQLAEEKEKYPDIYRNTQKIRLTENYIMDIFDAVCSVLKQEELQLGRLRMFLCPESGK